MEPLLAILSELSPPQLETIVRAAIDLLTADEKAALWTALGPPGMVQVLDLDQKAPPQCGVKRPPKAEVCQAECKICYVVLNAVARDKLFRIILIT